MSTLGIRTLGITYDSPASFLCAHALDQKIECQPQVPLLHLMRYILFVTKR